MRFVGELVPLGDRKGRRCSLSTSAHRSRAAGSNVSNEERISPPCASLEVRVSLSPSFSLCLDPLIIVRGVERPAPNNTRYDYRYTNFIEYILPFFPPFLFCSRIRSNLKFYWL